MASITMAASFLGSTTVTGRSPVATQRRFVIANAAKETEAKSVTVTKKESSNGRRDMMFVAAAAVLCSVAGVAVAEEPKRGSPEAKKKYAPVCVTMPTARICRN
ncbi:Photosystem II 5 kDa protein, chloroplastic [Quillaja saponaria]|uniref:Photosystem II 5 kDa protein, chloroplastic n=1 Tax=Quillaja saponaria TaxID=32244 RepID=A0AAD7VN53_QUISA|nr:Photosystem II 5 kDa protein, chloroplastic [Quillaja saponaria]